MLQTLNTQSSEQRGCRHVHKYCSCHCDLGGVDEQSLKAMLVTLSLPHLWNIDLGLPHYKHRETSDRNNELHVAEILGRLEYMKSV